jgi:hypothetical protein
MKKLRLILVMAILASAFVVMGAGPAKADCYGEPVNPCVVVCQIGLGNKYTRDLFKFCYVW